ncbi:MAG: hypothetical protein V3S22_05045 [Candidatus Neomarinimicrobiota bacterium]
MNSITLFMRDLKLASVLSDHIAIMDKGVEIHENLDDFSLSSKLAFIDLDENDFGSVDFISSLFAKAKNIKIIGFLSSMQKDKVDKFKSAGCTMVLTKSSAVKNISSLVKEFGNN